MPACTETLVWYKTKGTKRRIRYQAKCLSGLYYCYSLP